MTGVKSYDCAAETKYLIAQVVAYMIMNYEEKSFFQF